MYRVYDAATGSPILEFRPGERVSVLEKKKKREIVD
jgi:hypothetical protein